MSVRQCYGSGGLVLRAPKPVRGRPGARTTGVPATDRIRDSVVALCDPLPHFVSRAPGQLGGTSSEVLMYVEDVDATVRRALDAGATLTQPVQDQVWGDRSGIVTDPFGQVWLIATHVEDVTPEQVAERVRSSAPPS